MVYLGGRMTDHSALFFLTDVFFLTECTECTEDDSLCLSLPFGIFLDRMT